MTAPDQPLDLCTHARTELERLGEDPATIEGILRVVHAFEAAGHSGASAPLAAAYLQHLFLYRPLTQLTDDPAEWIDRSGISGYRIWQSARHPAAMTTDGARTYWLTTDNPTRLYQPQPSTPTNQERP